MLWRAVVLALCLTSAFLNVFETIVLAGTDGVTPEAAVGAQRLQIAVAPNSPAARAGMHSGDIVDLGALSPHDRWLHGSLRVPGEQLRYPIERNGALVTYTTTFEPTAPNAATQLLWLACAGAVWVLTFCFLLVWRRPDNTNVRLLAGALIFWTLGGALWRYNLWLPHPILASILDILNKIVNAASIVCLIAYLFRVASATRVLRIWAAITYLFCACHIALGFVEVYSVFAGSAWLQLKSLPLEQDCYTAALALSALCVLLALPRVERPRRASVAWAILPIAYLNFSEAAAVFYGWVSSSIWPQLVIPVIVIYNIGSFVAPLGLTYAAFTRRVADIGFALNRAVVFSGVSVIVVGVFVLAEWLLSDVVARLGHVENLLVTAAIALGLGFSIRFIHSRVEHVIDHLLFAKRRAAEAAISTLAREAAYITRIEPLIDRVEETLRLNTDASTIETFLRDGSAYGGVDENDPAFVAMRERRSVLDLHLMKASALRGELAFPLVARGNLLGAIVVGAKRTGEAFAPDEKSAMMNLAQSVAHALDVLMHSLPVSNTALLLDMRTMLADIHRALAQRNVEEPRLRQ